MSYDDNFYQKYAAYLKEPVVRRNHDFVFEIFRDMSLGAAMSHKVVDLGCGTGEYRTYGLPNMYIGIDKEKSPAAEIVADYTASDFPALPFEPNVFVSLFSIEACLPAPYRYSVYDGMFSRFPSIRHALVAGFYYESRAKEATVTETGGLLSYQTIEPLERFTSRYFNETRIVMKTPSNFFGRDVVEVWKVLERRV